LKVKHSVSVAVHDPARPGQVLLVQRPANDEDLPGVWGLPAASLAPAEAWEDAAARVGREKLGVELRLDGMLREGSLHRHSYTLQMRLYSAVIAAGAPHVPQRAAGVTQYRAWRWGDPAELEPAAARGSLCSQLFLRTLDRGGRPGR
jgi:8-oxo-dGTP diphosphatase